ncbi:MAG: FkbM family methyltransferase [Thermoproteota archaeon]|nr:FkbM family methyltransferase [Thermoproteota archaeon]
MRGLNSWLLKETKGVRTLDKGILYFLKIAYLSLRILLRVALGRRRRDRIFIERGFDFNTFLYKVFKVLGMGNSMLLRINVPKYDYKFYCRINNREDLVFMTNHEEDIIEHFTPKEGDIVVDIGAHIGHYTIIASKRVGINGKVVAIEANPDNFKLLNCNIKLNQLANVIPLNYAVFSKETKIKLYLPSGESGFTKYNTIMPNWINTQEKFVEVNANTLDYLLQLNKIRQEEVNWIKIDVEGAEFEVLKGATNVLSKSKDIAILMELHGPPDVYRPKVEEFVNLYNFKIEFEKSYEENGSMHIIMQKSASTM